MNFSLRKKKPFLNKANLLFSSSKCSFQFKGKVFWTQRLWIICKNDFTVVSCGINPSLTRIEKTLTMMFLGLTTNREKFTIFRTVPSYCHCSCKVKWKELQYIKSVFFPKNIEMSKLTSKYSKFLGSGLLCPFHKHKHV